MDDGTVTRSGFVLYTNSFTKKEVELLIEVLKIKFDLNCTIQSNNVLVNKPYFIYIKNDS
jgi:hypothetical protein